MKNKLMKKMLIILGSSVFLFIYILFFALIVINVIGIRGTLTLMPNGADMQSVYDIYTYQEEDLKQPTSIKLKYNLFSDNDLSGVFSHEGIFYRAGYDLIGWSTTPDGIAEYATDSVFNSSHLNVTLYAVWTASLNTIIFDCNEGEGEDWFIELRTGETQKLPKNSFTHPFAVFAGWTKEPTPLPEGRDFVGTRKVDWKDEDMLTYDGTYNRLYAVWELKKEFIEIIYHSNYPNDAKEKTYKQTETYDNAYNMKLKKNKFKCNGYEFVGWACVWNDDFPPDKPKNLESDYIDGETTNEFEFGGVVHLYAVWEKADMLTIIYHSNYPNDAKEQTYKQIEMHDYSSPKMKLMKNKFKCKGYKFVGWLEIEEAKGHNHDLKNKDVEIIEFTPELRDEVITDHFYMDDVVHLYAAWLPVK